MGVLSIVYNLLMADLRLDEAGFGPAKAGDI
jgi:hypothetical protein